MTNLNFLSIGGHCQQFGTDAPRHFFSIFTHIHIYTLHMHIHISQFSRWLSGKESAYQCRQCRVERPPEEGNGNPLQYYCLGNPKDRGAWQATVHGLAKESDMTYQLNNNSNNNIHVSIKLYILFRVCVKKMPICCSCFLQLFSFYLFFN